MSRHDKAMPLDGEAIAAGCHAGAQQLDQALGQPFQAVITAVDDVERVVARLRDGLIAHRRAATITGEMSAALDSLNATLSLIVAVEYPQGALQRAYIEQARDLLRAIAEQP